MISQTNDRTEYRKGLTYALTCSVLWGLLPMYWKSIDAINPHLIMLYRLVLCFILMVVIDLVLYKKEGILAPLRKKGAKLTFFLAGVLISANWGIYIWAVNSGFIIQTSIGYYIEPLMVCVFGVFFFHEKLDKYKGAAMILALCGVLYMLIRYQQLPVIALSLAVTFACYAAIKKKVSVPPLLALLYETMYLMPVALAIILYMEFQGNGAFAVATTQELCLLSLSGLFTAIPLVLFAMAASRIDFITLGVTEYASPSMALVLGVLVYREPFDMIQFTAFVLIWAGLVVFTIGGIRNGRKKEAEEAERFEEGEEVSYE